MKINVLHGKNVIQKLDCLQNISKNFVVNDGGIMRIGVLGGGYFWGVWEKKHNKINPETPYGMPSDDICYGDFGVHQIYTLQRHGMKHQFEPSAVPWRANVYAMFLQKLDIIIHVTTCGAMNSNYQVGDVVLFDQIIDLTKIRPNSFGPPVIKSVTHPVVAEPINKKLISTAASIFKRTNFHCHIGGTLVVEEGPRFSTNAEIKMFRMLGGDIINQTSAPEVFLCNEIELPVLALTLVTNQIETVNGNEYEDIADNIRKFKTVMPTAIRLLLENLEKSMELSKSNVKPFDVTKLDLRTV